MELIQVHLLGNHVVMTNGSTYKKLYDLPRASWLVLVNWILDRNGNFSLSMRKHYFVLPFLVEAIYSKLSNISVSGMTGWEKELNPQPSFCCRFTTYALPLFSDNIPCRFCLLFVTCTKMFTCKQVGVSWNVITSLDSYWGMLNCDFFTCEILRCFQSLDSKEITNCLSLLFVSF